MAAKKRYFPELTGVRAVMMACVFNCHFNLVTRASYGEPLYRFSPTLHDWLLRFTHELAVGVPVFYVLSGFLIYYRYGHRLALLDRRWTWQYIQNRVARIYPIYFLVLLATYYCWAMLPGLFADRTFPDTRTLLATFTLTQSFFPDLLTSGIPQAWTLTIEETFYFTAPLLFLVARRFGILVSCLAVFLFGVLLVNVPLIGPYYHNPAHVFGRTLCGPIGCFGFGAFLAQVVIRRGDRLPFGRRPLWTYTGLGASVLVVLAVSRIATWLPQGPYAPRGVEHGLGAALIFTIFPACVAATFWGLITERSLLKRFLGSRLIVLFGNSSYCFYLIHFGALQRLISIYISNDYLVLFVIISALSVPMYLLIEKPANAYLKQLGHVPATDPLRGFPALVRRRPAVFAYALAALLVIAAMGLPQVLRSMGNVAAHNGLLREDGLYETLQAVFCAAAATVFAFALFTSRRFPNWPHGREWRRRVFVAGLMLTMLMMFGEEISWGQRLFGFEAPAWIKAHNFQGEMTLHNWDVFQPLESGNRLQNVWLLLVVAYLGVLPLLANKLRWVRGTLDAIGLPLASLPVAMMTLGSFAWYVATDPWSEVLELVFDLLLLMFAVEVALSRPREEPARHVQWLPLTVTGAIAPLLVLLLFQGGERSLPAVRSRELANQANQLYESGHTEDAVRQWQHALAVWPRNGPAHWALGQVAARQGDLAAADAHFRQTVAMQPDHAEAYVALAKLRLAEHRGREAIALLREALRLDPNNPDYGIALAESLLRLGKTDQALRQYRRLFKIDQDNTRAANNLAWYLATLPDARLRSGGEAVSLARMICERTDFRQPSYLSTLAAAYAEVGRFDEAVRTATQAGKMAHDRGQETLARRTRQRIEQYRAGRPLREKPAN